MFKAKIQIACFFLIILIGCQSSTGSQEKVVRINFGGEPHTLDPRVARDPKSQTLMRMFFEGLTRIGPDEVPQLALAQSVEISKDLKTYTFTLRDTKWSNGDPLTANDFASTWKKILDPKFLTDNASQLYLIKNAKAVKRGILEENALGVQVLDDHTLLVELEYPIPYALELFSAPFFFPVNQKLDAMNSNWAEKKESYVSNGPFILSDWKHHDRIIAKKNPKYWEEKSVQIEKIEMMMLDTHAEMNLFEKKELHWVGSPLSVIPVDSIPYLKKTGRLFVKPRDETAFLRTNVETIPLNHPKMRRALALAIDRKAIVEHVTQGGQLPALCLVPPSMQLQKEPYFEDGAKKDAEELFEEALAELGIERKSFPKIVLTYINSERAHLITQVIQQQWYDALGIQVKLEALEGKVFFDRISKQDFDLAYCSWGADFHDPVNFLEGFKYKTQSTNNTQWKDANYTQLLDDSYGFSDSEERFQLLKNCEKILIDAMPIIPILHYSMLYMKDDKLNGVFLSSLGNLDFKWATMENKN